MKSPPDEIKLAAGVPGENRAGKTTPSTWLRDVLLIGWFLTCFACYWVCVVHPQIPAYIEALLTARYQE